MTTHSLTRRSFTAASAGFATGVFALPLLSVAAAEATPAGDTVPLGYVSTRLRSVETAEAHDIYVDLVREDFAPQVEGLEGLQAYIVANLIDDPTAHVSITVLDQESRFGTFRDIVSNFITGVEETISAPVGTEEWEGDLLIAGSPVEAASAAEATPADAAPEGYLAVRVHTSLPGTDPRDFVPLARSGFLPIVAGLPGFQGYLWYPIDGGFVAISLFDSEEAAEESNVAARDWAAEFLMEYTDGNPQVINANVVYASLPVFE